MEETENYASLKSLFILETVARYNSYIGIHEICADTGYSQSTVHRILNEMVSAGFIEKNERLKKYRTGIRAAVLASNFMQSSGLIAYSRDEMLRLRNLTGETVHLLSLNGYEVIYVNKINTTHTLGLMSYIGKTNPLHCTSGGKAIAAYMPESWVDDYLAHSERQRFTPSTLVKEDEIRRELRWIREHGYALDRGEHHSDVNCVSAPIFNSEGKTVAAISIAAPSYRFSIQNAEALSSEVIESCRIVSNKLSNDK